jgi:hypothetical protein
MVIPAQPRKLQPVANKPKLPPLPPIPRPGSPTPSTGGGDGNSWFDNFADDVTNVELKLWNGLPYIGRKSPASSSSLSPVAGKSRFQTETREIANVVRNVPSGTIRFFGGLGIDLVKQSTPFIWQDDRPYSDPNSTTRQFATSVGNTLQFWNRVPDYAEQWQAGGPISGMLIEDLGNISFMGRGAARGASSISKATGASAAESAAAASVASRSAAASATRGAMADAAAAAERAALYTAKSERMAKISGWADRTASRTGHAIDYVDKAANFPFKPYVWAGKGLGKAYREGLYVEQLSTGWGARAAKSYIQQIDDLRKANPEMPDNHPDLQLLRKKAARNIAISLTHATKAKIRQAVRNSEFEAELVKQTLLNIQKNPEFKDVVNPATGEAWGELSQIENEAIIAVINGRAALVKYLVENLNKTPEEIAELGRYDATPEYHLSGSGARLSIDFVNGNLSPEQYQRLSSAVEGLMKALVEVAQKSVDGVGRRSALSTDYLIPLPFVNRLKVAVAKSKNKVLIDLFAEAEENGIFELPANDPVRQQFIMAIVEALPDELALDPSMYPASMRENIEFYRRVRRSFNQEATGAALGEPLPPRDGRPRAPKGPWDPFKDPDPDAEVTDRPEQFDMPPSRGRLNAAENLLGKTKEKLKKLGDEILKITDKIALLEEKHVKLQQQVRKYDVVDAHLAGMNEKAIAKKYRIPVSEVRAIIAKSPIVKQAAKLAETTARLEELQKVIGKKRASLPENAVDAELAVLQQELANTQAAAASARQAVDAARNINEIARQADESAISNLTDAIVLADDELYDGEMAFERAGGDLDTLKVEVDPKEVFPVTPERGDAYIEQLKAVAQQALEGLEGSSLQAVIPNFVTAIESAWNDANEFMENAQTPAELRVADLRMEQLGDVINDVTQELNKAFYETPEGMSMEQAVGEAIVKVLGDETNQRVIAGTAPLTKGGVVRGGEPRTTIFNKLNAKRNDAGALDLGLINDWSNPNIIIMKKSAAVDELIQSIIDDTADTSVFPQREVSSKVGTVHQLATAANIIARYVKEVRAATTKEAKIQLILNPPDYVPAELYAEMTRGMSRGTIPADENGPTHPLRKFSKKSYEYLRKSLEEINKIENHFAVHKTATQITWTNARIPGVRVIRDSQGGAPTIEITLPSVPKTGVIPSLKFSVDAPVETVLQYLDILEDAINKDRGAQELNFGAGMENNIGWLVRIEGLTKAKASLKTAALKDIVALRKAIQDIPEWSRSTGIELVRPDSLIPGVRDNIVPIDRNASDIQDLFWDEEQWPGREEASSVASNIFAELDDFDPAEGLTQDQTILNNIPVDDPVLRQQIIDVLKEAIENELKGSKKFSLASDLKYVVDVIEGRGEVKRLAKVDDVLEQAKPPTAKNTRADYVVIPCGAAKGPVATTAAEMYQGSMFKDALATAREMFDDDRIYIISAEYGLLRLDDVIEPYDKKLGDPGSVDAATISRQLRDQGIENGSVLSLLPKNYNKLFENGVAGSLGVNPQRLTVEQYFAGTKGIGEQKGRLSNLRKETAAQKAKATADGAVLIDPELEQLANSVAQDPALYANFKAQVEERAMLERDIESMRNPTPEDVETYRKDAQAKAQEEVRTYAGVLEGIGGKWDRANDSVTFYVNVRSGTAEWEWWDKLDSRERRRLARTYFRSTTERSTAAKGPKLIRVADNIDQLADPYGLTPDEWGQQFLETVREYERAKKALKESKSKNFDPLAAIDENPELQQAQDYLDRLINEEGVDNDLVTVVNRAREILGDNEIPSLRVIADKPTDVVPERKISDPTVRRAAYEADVINAMAKDATKKMRAAQRATERLAAFEEFIVQSEKYRGEAERLIQLQKTGTKARLALAKNAAAQSALREKIKDKKKKARKLKIIENRLESSQTLADIQSMGGAAPLRVAMEGGYPSEQFAVGLPDGEDFQFQGPMYVPTGRPAVFTGGLAMDLQRAGLSGFEILTSEHYRDGDRQTIFSIRGVAARLGKDVGRMSSNESYRMLVAQFGNTGIEVLGEDLSRSLYEKAYQKVSRMSEDDLNQSVVRVGADIAEAEGGTAAFSSGVPNPKAAFNAALKEEYGRLVVIEMANRGFKAIDPYSKITSRMPIARVTHETMFVPTGFSEAIAKVEAVIDPASWNGFLRGAHKVTSQFKTSTLVLSVAWQLGDLFSNMIIAQMSGVNVVDMIRRMKEVKAEEYGPGLRTLVDATSELPTPTPKIRIAKESPIQDISASLADRRYLYNIPEGNALPPLLTRLTGKQYPEAVRGRGVINTSFKINETINRIQRHAYFLEVLDTKLKAKGVDLDTVAADGSWKNDPELRKIVLEAADTANDFLGDFADLSMSERKYVTPFIPFYAWTKHIHKVFMMLGSDSPQSLRWYIYMGTLVYDPDEDPMGLRYGNPTWFGGAFSTNILNPFGDVFGGPIGSVLADEDVRPALNTLGPVPRIGAAVLTGRNIAKGFQPISRPSGSGAYTLSGSEISPPLLPFTRPRELLGFTAQQFPIVSRAMNVAPGSRIPGTRIALGPVARYDTGEVRLNPRTRQPNVKYGGRLAAVGRLFSLPGIPYQADSQIEDVMRSARDRLRTIETLKRRRAIETGDTVP